MNDDNIAITVREGEREKNGLWLCDVLSVHTAIKCLIRYCTVDECVCESAPGQYLPRNGWLNHFIYFRIEDS